LTAREGLRWPLIDRGLRYDFESFRPRLDAAQRHGVELIYDLFHYGYPKDLDPLSEEFIERFGDYCYETARFLREEADGPYFFTPVNEPSYLAWAGGEAALFAPHLKDKGYDLKVQWARAGIAGIDAIRSVLPNARMVNADPLCRVLPNPDEPHTVGDAKFYNEVAVFESWDMLAGRILPELGGSPEHLDIVGINYYWTNQWVWGRPEAPLSEGHCECMRLEGLVREVYGRYGRPIIISETAHSQPNKAWWLREVAKDAAAVRREGIPLEGVCLYPILGMPEWHDRDIWTQMGLWEVQPDGTRIVHEDMAESLRWAQAHTSPVLALR
jgi:hypothetical protein